MSTVITTDRYYLQFLSNALAYCPSPVAQCIVCIDSKTGYPVAGVIYDSYNSATVHAHIWCDAERRPSREWMAAIFDYPFNRLGVYKIIGQVNSFNYDAIKLDEHFGFVLEARIQGYYEEGSDLLVYTMTRDQCRVLNSRRWAKMADKVARA